MLLKTIFKRVLSNFIDLILFILIYIILGYISNFERTENNMNYILFVTFILYFIIPIIIVKNTFGKLLLNVSWLDNSKTKYFLALKYSIYFLFFAPKFSLISLLANIPIINASNYDKLLSIQFFCTFLTLDIIIYLLSKGKYHIVDYIFNLQIKNLSYQKNELKSLSIILSFVSIFFIINITCFRFNLSFQNINNSISKDIYNERFPIDKFYGSRILVIKQKTSQIILPNNMLSFLFEKEYNQKILFLYLPYNIFNSTVERKRICYELINQSLTNDFFSEFKPEQTKIVLTTIKEGYFFEDYDYRYTYYYSHKIPQWGIYSGIKADSAIIKDYVNFVTGIENDNNEKLKLILKKSKKNIKKNFEIEDELKFVHFNSVIYCDRLEISSKKNKLTLKKIDFNKADLQGNFQLNFPVQSLNSRVHFFNILSNQTFENDENVYNLIFARKEISDKYL